METPKLFLLSTEENEKLTKIILQLVKRNMSNGATYGQAKAQVYNRLNNEYPYTLAAWLIVNKGSFNI